MLAPRQEVGPTLLGELPAESGHDKVEVWSRPDEEGAPALELVSCRWGSGLGWYVQKRLTLDAPQIEALRSLLIPAEAGPLPAPRLSRPAVPVERDGNVVRLIFPE